MMRMYTHWWEGKWNLANVTIAGILSTLWGMVGDYFMEIWLFLVFAIVAVFVDLFFGILSALKYKEPLVSRGLYRTMEKLAVYSVVICMMKFFQVIFHVEFLYLTYAVSGLIAMTELKSIAEHAEKITQVPFYALVQLKVDQAWEVIVGKRNSKNKKL